MIDCNYKITLNEEKNADPREELKESEEPIEVVQSGLARFL